MTGVLGVVMAGGLSLRYGRPKWRAEVAGVAMGRRAATALAEVSPRVVAIGGDAELAEVLGVEAWPDLRPGLGPLGGLHAALAGARRDGFAAVLVLGCDLPLVNGAALSALLGASDDLDRVVVPEGARGLEPLCARYPVWLLERVEEALDRGEGALHDLLDGVKPLRVPREAMEAASGRAEVLLNVNRPMGRMRAESLLAEGPPLVCVVGKKNSGKTTFTVALTAELVGRGHRVMTVKHGHGFDLDRPGTDSWRHRHEGGASRVLLAGPHDVAMVGTWGPGGEPTLREMVDRYLDDAAIVVAEGWKAGPDPKVEVYRSAAHRDPIYDSASPLADTFLAILTDRGDFRPGGAPVPVLPLSDRDRATRTVADLVESVLLP